MSRCYDPIIIEGGASRGAIQAWALNKASGNTRKRKTLTNSLPQTRKNLTPEFVDTTDDTSDDGVAVVHPAKISVPTNKERKRSTRRVSGVVKHKNGSVRYGPGGWKQVSFTDK